MSNQGQKDAQPARNAGHLTSRLTDRQSGALAAAREGEGMGESDAGPRLREPPPKEVEDISRGFSCRGSREESPSDPARRLPGDLLYRGQLADGQRDLGTYAQGHLPPAGAGNDKLLPYACRGVIWVANTGGLTLEHAGAPASGAPRRYPDDSLPKNALKDCIGPWPG